MTEVQEVSAHVVGLDGYVAIPKAGDTLVIGMREGGNQRTADTIKQALQNAGATRDVNVQVLTGIPVSVTTQTELIKQASQVLYSALYEAASKSGTDFNRTFSKPFEQTSEAERTPFHAAIAALFIWQNSPQRGMLLTPEALQSR